MTRDDHADISSLPLGPISSRMLRSVGITTMGDLREAGAVEAFVRYRIVGEQPSLNLLWALVAGLRGAHWASLGWMKRSA